MAKKKSQKKETPKQQAAPQAEAQRPKMEDPLGEFAGIQMDDAPREPKKDESPSGRGEAVELSVGEDRTRLLLQGIAYLLLAFLGLFLVVLGVGGTQLTQNVVLMVLLVVGLPLAWFASKAMGRRLGRFAFNVDVIDFGEKNVYIYEGSDAKKPVVVPYGDIKSYKLIRQGKALRLLLSGDWVKHPSGFHLVDINRPFMASTLEGLEGQILDVMRSHRVRQAKK